jgi:putative Mg2+ transporter-C (MgtC) family protein
MNELVESARPYAHIVGRLALAALLGSVLGLEREWHHRAAGLRTNMLVALGSAVFTLVAIELAGAAGTAEASRIPAQIVTGIGFLGAGAIIREGLSVRGLTTAGSLWVVAAVGMACGAGFYLAGVVTTVLTLFALGPLRILGHRVVERFRAEENRIIVELQEGQGVGPLLDVLPDVRQFEVEDERDRRVVTIELEGVDDALLAQLTDLPYVVGVRWHK